jgi:hypothetical protein
VNEWPSEDDMPYPPTHPKGQHAQRGLPWSDPNSDPMGDMQEVIRTRGASLGRVTKVTVDGVDLTPYLAVKRGALEKPASRLEVHLERSRERVRQQLGKVTHSWRDR